MATRKALVLVGGQIQQLQSGDTLAGPVAENDTVSLTNGDAGSHTIGQAIYISAADTGRLAKADAAASSQVVAFATGTITAGAVGSYQSSGVLSGMSGLTAGSVYYLSDATAGLITATAPSTLGRYVQEVGVALSTTELLIRPHQSILL